MRCLLFLGHLPRHLPESGRKLGATYSFPAEGGLEVHATSPGRHETLPGGDGEYVRDDLPQSLAGL